MQPEVVWKSVEELRKVAWKSVKDEEKVALKNVKSLKNKHVMYKRKIEAVLEAWKKEANHKPLVVKGVRQCGKTSSVKQFAYANYEHVVYMDFRDDDDIGSDTGGSFCSGKDMLDTGRDPRLSESTWSAEVLPAGRTV